MTSLQQDVLSFVVDQILEAEMVQFRKEVDSLVAKNRELLGTGTANGFIYGDRWFSGTGHVIRSNQSLHPSLSPQAANLMNRLKAITDDHRFMTQILGKLIQPCQDLREMRNELPEVIISLDPAYWGPYERTRAPAKSIQSDPRTLRQYEKVLVKIHTYCTMRFLV